MSALIFDDDYPEILQLIALSIYEALKDLGVPHQRAAELAFAAAEAVRNTIGGIHVYISRGQAYRLSARDREIYRKFNGRNYEQLAREYDKSEERIRQIIRRCRAEDLLRRQGGLFDEPDDDGDGND